MGAWTSTEAFGHLVGMSNPADERYRRKYPSFPGVAETVRLLTLGGTRGGYLDVILSDLREHAPQHLDDVTQAVDEASDERIRTLLVGELAETGDQRLVGFFTRLLSDANESVRHWAEQGLRRIDTKAARKVLFEHRVPQHQRPAGHHEVGRRPRPGQRSHHAPDARPHPGQQPQASC